MNPVDHPHGGGEGRTSGGDQQSVLLVLKLKVRRPEATREQIK